MQRASLRVAAKSQTFSILLFIRFGDSQSQLRGLERTQILRLQILQMSFLAAQPADMLTIPCLKLSLYK